MKTQVVKIEYGKSLDSPLNSLSVLLAVIATALLWIASSSAFAQTGDDAYRFAKRAPGLTAYSMGLSGTGIAGVSDASALFTNPAGLAWADGSHFSGSLSGLRTLDKGAFSAPGSSTELENDVTASGLSNLSYLFKLPTVRGSMVVGAAFSQVSTFERSLLYDGDNSANSLTDYLMPLASEFTLQTDADGTYPEFDRTLSFMAFETYVIDLDQDKLDAGDSVPFTPAVTAGTLSQIGFVDETGRMSEFSVGAAMEVAKGVMFGVSLNVPFGNYTFNRELEEEDYTNANDGFNGTTDFDKIRFRENVQSDIAGVNMRFGVSTVTQSNVTVGLTVETPTYYSINDTYSTLLSTWFDKGHVFSYGGNDRDAGTGTFSYSIKTPWKIGLGGAFAVSGLRLAVDFDYVDWSQMELDSKGYEFIDENQAITRGLDATTNTRMSVSYTLNDKLEVMGGLAMYPDPHATSLEVNGSKVDRDRRFVSAGLGYKIGKSVKANVSWMGERFEDVYQVYTEVDNAPFVSEEVTRSRFQLGLTFGF